MPSTRRRASNASQTLEALPTFRIEPAKFAFAIILETAKALGFEIPRLC